MSPIVKPILLKTLCCLRNDVLCLSKDGVHDMSDLRNEILALAEKFDIRPDQLRVKMASTVKTPLPIRAFQIRGMLDDKKKVDVEKNKMLDFIKQLPKRRFNLVDKNGMRLNVTAKFLPFKYTETQAEVPIFYVFCKQRNININDIADDFPMLKPLISINKCDLNGEIAYLDGRVFSYLYRDEINKIPLALKSDDLKDEFEALVNEARDCRQEIYEKEIDDIESHGRYLSEYPAEEKIKSRIDSLVYEFIKKHNINDRIRQSFDEAVKLLDGPDYYDPNYVEPKFDESTFEGFAHKHGLKFFSREDKDAQEQDSDVYIYGIVKQNGTAITNSRLNLYIYMNSGFKPYTEDFVENLQEKMKFGKMDFEQFRELSYSQGGEKLTDDELRGFYDNNKKVFEYAKAFLGEAATEFLLTSVTREGKPALVSPKMQDDTHRMEI